MCLMMHFFLLGPPVIDPFEFPRALEEGDRSKILCTVMKGDPPFVIRWFKDGQLMEDKSSNVVILDDYSVALIFSKVTLADRGNYTCIANNAVASANHTSIAVVHGMFINLNCLNQTINQLT